MKMKIILITGGTGGIGLAAAIELAKQNHQVIVTGRTTASAEKAVAEIKSRTGNLNIHYLLADLTSTKNAFDLAKGFLEKYTRLDVLINNAGIVAHERATNKEGIELNFAVHTLAPYVLFKQLLPLLLQSRNARVVNVLTQNHEMVSKASLDDYQSENNYVGMNEYGKTKLYNLWWMYAAAKEFNPNQISFFGADPGPNNTQLMTDAMSTGKSWPLALRLLRPVVLPIMKIFLKSKPVSEGAKSLVYAATSIDLENKTALYISPKGTVGKSSKLSHDEVWQQRIKQVVEQKYLELLAV